MVRGSSSPWRVHVTRVLIGLSVAAAPVLAQPPEAPTAAAQPGAAAAATRTTAAATGDTREASLRLLNREIVVFRVAFTGGSPEGRVERAKARFRDLPEHSIDRPLTRVPFSIEGQRGVQFLLGDHFLFAVVEGDAELERGQSLEQLVDQTQHRLEDLRRAWHESRDKPRLLRGLAEAVVATLVLGLLVWLVYRGSRRLVLWLETVRDRVAARVHHVDWRELLARLAVATMQLVQWIVLAALAYVWLRFLLGRFALTEPIAHRLGDWFWGKATWVADGVLESLPGLVTVVIILLLTRAVVDVLGYFFRGVQQGRLIVPMIHPETTTASRRIVTFLAWGLGVALAYPYLPGSSSEAFKGISVLLGVMVTLGSTGLVTQVMSGLVVIYARALRRGDLVEVNGVRGVVTEVAWLATKIVNVRNEEFTVPHSVLVSSPIRNFSRLAAGDGTLLTTKVTIGFDVPWRQVHAMLEEAARRTPAVRAEPAPYVIQRALSDFYVEYELYVSIDQPLEQLPTLSALHGHIQDVFNQHDVQIMSPHFLAQPERPVVVPPSQWFRAPARKPAA